MTESNKNNSAVWIVGIITTVITVSGSILIAIINHNNEIQREFVELTVVAIQANATGTTVAYQTGVAGEFGFSPTTAPELPRNTPTFSLPPTNIPSAQSFDIILFCVDEPSEASGYSCVNPVTRLPSGISKFYYSRSFANIPIGTRINSRWYYNGTLIPILERTITYSGVWVTPTSINYSWVQEVPNEFELYDGVYTIEVFFEGQSVPYQVGSVQIGF